MFSVIPIARRGAPSSSRSSDTVSRPQTERPVRGHEPLVHLEAVGPSRGHLPEQLEVAGHVIGVGELLPVQGGELLLAVAEHVTERIVGQDRAPLEVDDPDADRCQPKDGTQLVVGRFGSLGDVATTCAVGPQDVGAYGVARLPRWVGQRRHL